MSITYSKNKIIPLSENKCVLKIINKNKHKIEIHHVDGGIINDNRIRCDYLFYDTKRKEHYLELKGSDIGHALEQIISTINILGKNIYKDSKVSFIICTRHPQMDSKIQKLKKKIMKEYNSKLIVKAKEYSHIID